MTAKQADLRGATQNSTVAKHPTDENGRVLALVGKWNSTLLFGIVSSLMCWHAF